MTVLGRILGRLIPESPARTAGEQLGMAIGLHQLVAELPDTTDPETTPDPHPHRED